MNLPSATDQLVGDARAGRTGYVCCCDAHSLTQARRQPLHRKILNHARLATPDGMPLVWAGRRSGFDKVGRTYGPDLMESVCAATTGSELSHFFYGGKPGVAAALCQKLLERYPGLKVAGHESPEWSADGYDLPVAPIKNAQAEFIWVGLSTPKQEAFMARYHQTPGTTGITIGVGAAFDFLSGRIRQAPKSWQRLGFEWLWRLGQEPRRLASRYLFAVPSFGIRLLAQQAGLIAYPLED